MQSGLRHRAVQPGLRRRSVRVRWLFYFRFVEISVCGIDRIFTSHERRPTRLLISFGRRGTVNYRTMRVRADVRRPDVRSDEEPTGLGH